MEPDDLHYLISRLNSVAGSLSNAAEGIPVSMSRAAQLEEQLGEVVDRIRMLYEAQRNPTPG